MAEYIAPCEEAKAERQEVKTVIAPRAPPPPVPTAVTPAVLSSLDDMKKELLCLRKKLEDRVRKEQEKRTPPLLLTSAREFASNKEIAKEISDSALVLEKVHAAALKHATRMVEVEMAPLTMILEECAEEIRTLYNFLNIGIRAPDIASKAQTAIGKVEEAKALGENVKAKLSDYSESMQATAAASSLASEHSEHGGRLVVREHPEPPTKKQRAEDQKHCAGDRITDESQESDEEPAESQAPE